jgi:hypothetical protein
VPGVTTRAATGANANPFYRVHPVADPIVAPGVTLSAATEASGNIIEFDTKPGGSYELLS